MIPRVMFLLMIPEDNHIFFLNITGLSDISIGIYAVRRPLHVTVYKAEEQKLIQPVLL